MSRLDVVKQLADNATRPLTDFIQQSAVDLAASAQSSSAADTTVSANDLFVWFEDTSLRSAEGRRGIAGLPEALLPWPTESGRMRVIERRYAAGHMHLLCAVRLRCEDKLGERIAALYTAALSVGTVAWIGSGTRYEQAWNEMFRGG